VPISRTRFPDSTPRALSIENTIVGIDEEELGVFPLPGPAYSPSSHCVVIGASV
jgi:hypothetical protein